MQKRLLAVMFTMVFVLSSFLVLPLDAQSDDDSPDLKFQNLAWGPIPMKLVRDETSFYVKGEVFNGGGKIHRRYTGFSLYFQMGGERIVYQETKKIVVDHNNPKGAPKSFQFSFNLPYNMISSKIVMLRKGRSIVKVPFYLLIDSTEIITESDEKNNKYGPFEATIDYNLINKVEKYPKKEEQEDDEEEEEG